MSRADPTPDDDSRVSESSGQFAAKGEELILTDSETGCTWSARPSGPVARRDWRLVVWVRVHNHEETIDRALHSVLELNSNEDVCVVILVHNSTDDLIARCESWRDRFPDRVEVLVGRSSDPSDVGQSYRRLLGGLYNSDYACILDGDDYWLAGRIQRIFDALNTEGPADVVIHASLLGGSASSTPRVSTARKALGLAAHEISANEFAHLHSGRLLASDHQIHLHGHTFSTRILNGLSEPDFVNRQGDLVFSCLMLRESRSFLLIPQPLAVYEVGSGTSGWNVRASRDARWSEAILRRNLEFLNTVVDRTGPTRRDLVAVYVRRLSATLVAQHTKRKLKTFHLGASDFYLIRSVGILNVVKDSMRGILLRLRRALRT